MNEDDEESNAAAHRRDISVSPETRMAVARIWEKHRAAWGKYNRKEHPLKIQIELRRANPSAVLPDTDQIAVVMDDLLAKSRA